MFDLVVALDLDAARAIHRTRPQLPGRRALLPDPDTVALCDDKLVFAQHLMRRGLDDVVPSIGPDLSYPYVLKPRVGEWGTDVVIIENTAQAEAHLEQLTSPEFFRQECVEGDREYTTHFVANEGRLLMAGTLEFRFGTGRYVKGVATPARRQTIVDHAVHDGLLADIVEGLGYTGIGCSNYKLVDGRPQIFEINPRVGGSMYRFADEILLTALAALSESQPGCTSAPTGARTRR